MRCYSLLVYIEYTASAAPSLAGLQVPAQARFLPPRLLGAPQFLGSALGRSRRQEA